MEYKTTIGLEVHAELKTKTKMFCACLNDPDEKRPNLNICPICMGHPGTLPVINKEAVKQVLKVGLALNGKLSDETRFDRKNYFYPDIPKGYQISQYQYPLVSGGNLEGVALARIHLEEDTARSSHDEGDYSLVDFNRAGVPLMELVTEPVMHSAEEVVNFAIELQKVLQYLNVSSANMEKGEMRLEANISVSNGPKLGTKIEVKNLNSFRSAEKAINFEIKRQIEVLKNGGKVHQETRGWDDVKQETFPQRSKESSKDYRYFPDPDLPKLDIKTIEDFSVDILRSEMSEIPSEKRSRLKKQYDIKDEDVKFYISNPELSYFFEKTASFLSNKREIQLLSNLIITDITPLGRAFLKLKEDYLATLVKMFAQDELSSRATKDILVKMIESGNDPLTIAKDENLIQKNNEAELANLVQGVIDNHKEVFTDYKNGKTTALQFLIGQAMKISKGSANPKILKTIFEKMLNN